jgi:ribosome modulation factor
MEAAMGGKKYSKQWYGNEGYRDGVSGKSHRHYHDGLLDRALGVSEKSAEKRDSYDRGWREGREQRNLRR